MTALSWDALGGDPAPGDPAAFEELARSFSETAANAGSAHGKLSRFAASVDDAIWSGEAADAFREKIGELPPRLEKLHASYGAAAEGMGDYARTLRELQDRATALLGRAQGAQAEKMSQERSRDQAQAADPTLSTASHDAAIADAEGRLRGVRREIEELREQRVAAEHRALGRLEDAEALGIKNDPWYKRAFDAVDRFIDEHADILRAISSALKVISAIAGVLSFIPFLAPICGPIALIAGGLALLTDAALAATGNGSWKALLVDAALMALPGAGRLLGTALKGTRVGVAAGRAVKSVRGAARSVGGKVAGAAKSVAGKAKQLGKRIFKGDPVDIATGEVVIIQTDVELPGALPLVLTRTYGSLSPVSGSFGPSWSSTLDQMLEIDDEGICYAAPDGMILVYPILGPGAEVLAAEGPRWPLWRSEEGSYTITDPGRGLSFHFGAPSPSSAIWPLTVVTDRNGHRIDFDHDAEGTLTEIRHSGGYHIDVESSGGLVTALRLRDSDMQEGHLLVRYGYDEAGRLAEVINSSGAPLRFDYDASGRIIRWEDRNGAWYRYVYDDEGRCVSSSGSGGFLDATFAHDTEKRVTVITDSFGHVTTYHLNDSGQVIREVDPLGHAAVSEWDAHDRLLARTDPLGRTTYYTYDEAGNVVSLTRPDESQILIEYNDLRQPISVIEADGAVWRLSYDEAGNLTELADPMGAKTSYAYDERGHLSAVTDALGHIRHIEINVAGLLMAVTDPLGATTCYGRDAFGRVISVTDPLGGVTRLGWTPEDKLASRTLPDGATERWSYDGEGNLIEYIDAAGNATRTEIGVFDLPIAETGPDGGRLELSYDTELRLVSITNPQGLTWRYDYDVAGNLIQETDFNGRVLSYAHDAAGQLAERTNGTGERTRFTRDLLGNVVEARCGETTTTFAYDPAGRMVVAANADATLTFERDPLGRILAETCNGATVVSTYDPLGRRTHRRTPSGAESAWDYDANDRPLALHTAGTTLAFGYDAGGREIERLFGDTTLAQSWDANHRLASQTLTAGRESPRRGRLVQRRSYRYRKDGYVTSIDDHLSGARRLDLDPTGRVVSVEGTRWAERYAYDPAGNITHGNWPSGIGSQDLDARGERTYAGTLIRHSGNIRYDHDAQGRVTLRQHKRPSQRPRTWRYTWDGDDRLVGVTTPNGQRWRYRYDPLGRRIAKECLGESHTVLAAVSFAWDGAVLAEQTEAGSGRTTIWEWEPGGFRPLSQWERTSLAYISQECIDERFYAVVTDVVGTPAELVDDQGNLAWRLRTTLWGALVDQEPDGVSCPLRFPGQYHDPETGLNYNYFRYYEPANGRYESNDPLGLSAGANPYTYVRNPTGWVDPLGLMSCPPSIRSRMRAAGPGNEFGLPSRGRIRYVPSRGYNPANPLPRGPQHGYIDRFYNEWVVGPSRTPGHPFEWDVQLSRTGREQIGWLSGDAAHVNVSPLGEVTHL